MFHATGLTGWQRAAMNTGTAPATTATPTEDAAKDTLETEIGEMQSQLDAMKTRLAEIEAKKA
jgi:hypothetical protein